MAPEKREWKKIVKKAVRVGVTVGAAAGTILPLVNFENTKRIANNLLFGREIDCSSHQGYDPMNPPLYAFKAIVIPGAGIVVNADGSYEPDDWEKLSLQAGAFAFRHHYAPRIILLDGSVGPEDGHETNRQFLQRAYKDLTGGTAVIPDDDISVDSWSINTSTNFFALWLNEPGLRGEDIVVLTPAYHAERSAMTGCNFGFKTRAVAAENQVWPESDETAERVNKINDNYDSSQMWKTNLKEKIELFWGIWDWWGVVPTILRRVVGFG